MSEFQYTGYAQEIIFGAGSLARLGEAVDRFGWRRMMLCSSGSLRRDGSVGAIESALGDRLVAIYERTQPHVPDSRWQRRWNLLSNAKWTRSSAWAVAVSWVWRRRSVSLWKKNAAKNLRIQPPLSLPTHPLLSHRCLSSPFPPPTRVQR